MTSKFNNNYNKRNIYTKFIKPVVIYACESWALSTRDIDNLLGFETQIL